MPPGRLKILVVTPVPPRSRQGNRVTALRWARILQQLGHAVHIDQEYRNQRSDLLVALHARRSHGSLARWCDQFPDRPAVLALTGTDLYGDIRTDASAQRSLELADRLIVLQVLGVDELPKQVRARTRVIYQSVPEPAVRLPPRDDIFEVCVIGHLRPVKDPFRAAQAVKLLPASSRIEVTHIGGALIPDMAEQARHEAASNPRYHWLGELPRAKTLRLLSRARLLVVSSRMEGGANVVGEALACSTPIISSQIAGSVGILGSDYPGYFPVGDSRALAGLLRQAETDVEFYRSLQRRCRKLRPLVDPRREAACWKALLKELFR